MNVYEIFQKIKNRQNIFEVMFIHTLEMNSCFDFKSSKKKIL